MQVLIKQAVLINRYAICRCSRAEQSCGQSSNLEPRLRLRLRQRSRPDAATESIAYCPGVPASHTSTCTRVRLHRLRTDTERSEAWRCVAWRCVHRKRDGYGRGRGEEQHTVGLSLSSPLLTSVRWHFLQQILVSWVASGASLFFVTCYSSIVEQFSNLEACNGSEQADTRSKCSLQQKRP